MTTLQEDLENLRRAWLDFAYEIVKPIVALAERLGMKPADWVRERQIRERHREDGGK